MLHAELTDALAARIQSEVATFLGLKQLLMSKQQSSDPLIQTKAGQLLQTQLALENELPDVLKRIDNIKGGAYTLSDMTTVSTFALSMEAQIKAVRGLGGVVTSSLIGVGGIVAAALLAGVGIYAFSKRGGQ